MRNLLFCLCLVVAPLAHAQVRVSDALNATAETKYVIGGIGQYKIVMDQIVVDKTATPSVIGVGYLRIEAPNSHVAVKAKDSNFEPVEIVKTESDGVYEYLVLGSGRIFIDAISVNKTTGALQWDDFVITVGPAPTPEPEPDPEPTPEPDPVPDDTIPTDDFDNLGRRVAGWAAGLDSRMQAAQIYRTSAEMLRSDPSMTVDDVSAYLVGKMKETVNYEAYTTFRSNIQADLQQRWDRAPFTRGILADYYDAIANGLGAGQ